MTPIYERTVVGTWLLAFLALMTLTTTLIMALGEDDPIWWLPAVWAAVFLWLAVLRIRVDTEALRIRFWTGVPRRTIPLAAIDAYRVTRSKRETHLGLALKPGDGKYVIAGPSAVNILLRDGRTVLIGTPDPEALVKALDRARKHSPGKE
ncbi:hypothetical protein KDK88_00060 [bacterium]|nr:hypothetical protein [bacterium]HPF34360.1 hypothetical protein [Candidatus Krumholzibacteria bacterium]HRX49864.1 hypothetical protein [Candidatus Krumholzibacteria bacterium]